MYTIYHNPRCTKSRQALQLLQEKGIEPEVLLYLENVPSASELEHLGKLMGRAPMDFIRRGEQEYKDHVKGKDLSDEDLYQLMSKYPKLIERPIIVRDGKEAVLGRPVEELMRIL